MKLPLYWVDAFASEVSNGNPAAVVPLTQWLPDALLQTIAFENGLAATAFLVRRGESRFELRWFSPTVELVLCGHATLAAAHTLWTELGQTGEVVTFDSHSSRLSVTHHGDRYELDFPSRPATHIDELPPELLAGLGSSPGHKALVAEALYYLCVYDSAATVRALEPRFGQLAALGRAGIIATAPGEDCDFVSRFFAPGIGIPEDPVTGSAHCTLIPYWAQRLGKHALHARQLSARGGELWCELRGDRVGITGKAALYLRGEIEI
jgi:predicted PhzF superfamily epimerase YddE/YHI9